MSKKLSKEEVLEQTRTALMEAFGLGKDQAADVVSNTFFGSEDPGQWSPQAVVIIHAESIPLPSPDECFEFEGKTYYASETWVKASDLIEGHFIEHINSAVAAVYRA